MDRQHSPSREPEIRFLIACPRSGSTLLMRIFAQSSECAATSRLVLTGNAQGSQDSFSPDLSILESPCRHVVFNKAKNVGKQFLICKEELGTNSQKGECLYDIFLTPSILELTRPIFLIRDPIRAFDSWKHVGWTDVQSLINCFTNIFRMHYQAPSHAISCVLYERLVQKPQNEVQRICARWGVTFSETMLDFKKPFGPSFIFPTDREEDMYCEKKLLGLSTTVEATSSVIPDVPPHSLLSNDEKDKLEEHLGRLYLRCWEGEVPRLRDVLLEKAWIGFDLDDTLHEFRKASSMATDEVLAIISGQYDIPMPALKQEYSRVLQLKTANAFSDGKTSFDYRKERFSLVLEHFSLPSDTHFMTLLLETYEATLSTSFELKCGALGLLSTLKNMGKKIVVITEGPQDAQERTVEALGIGSYIDFLATTNHFGVSKTAGLFTKVLEHLGISSGDMAYIGDNVQRDMEPALSAGIFSIHFTESKNVSLNLVPPQINTLRKLQYIISG
ncbi:Haloacid dehalogenase-like hydrolase [Beauveria brongniartii RCEF 3172]|uniref:Haloacid dehalogenase-like hydrolase n=1 Tax=Beauveria brongniartii RCEF 3172 TaxID=1081107 RepID=A0A167D337_9HYPO|nr:Haloacid dehalogenase-like hydrolase [Beauveria brongniartii RCEF 3172]